MHREKFEPLQALRVIQRHEALSLLADEVKANLARQMSFVRLPRGEPLWRKGERATELHLVGRGLVALSVRAPSGRDLISMLHAPVEGVDVPALMGGRPHESDACAFAGEAIVATLGWAPVLSALESCSGASLAVARIFSAYLQHNERRWSDGTLSVEHRLARQLLELADRFGDELDDGTVILPLRMTRGDLGNMVATTQETVTRTVSRWSRMGLVSFFPQKVVLASPLRLREEVGLTYDRLQPRAARVDATSADQPP